MLTLLKLLFWMTYSYARPVMADEPMHQDAFEVPAEALEGRANRIEIIPDQE